MRRLRRSLKFSGHALYQCLLIAVVVALVLGPAAVVSAAPLSPVQPNVTSATSGISWTGAMGVQETTAQIMARQVLQGILPPAAAQSFFHGRLNPGAKKDNPASAGMLQSLSTGSQGGALVSNVPNVFAPNAVSFDGPASSLSPCGTPPDTMGAVGPAQFIVTVNCNFISYDKTTGLADGVLNATPGVFFNSVTGGAGVSDPHIRYDRTSGRWFIVMITVTTNGNLILLAVSSAATITLSTPWTFFSFPDSLGHAGCLGDYPTPGIDANAIYIGVNQFCGVNLSYLASDGFVVQKSSVLGAGPIQVTPFANLGTVTGGLFTPQGVDNPDPAATEGYFIGVDNASWGKLDLRRVSNPGSLSPTISGTIVISTALQASPLTQPHLGNSNPLGGITGQLDGSDGRLLGAYFRNGSLWTALDSGVASNCTATGGAITRDAVFWYELTGIPTGSTPSVHQAGSVCDTTASSPAFYSYGTIMVNGQGHAVVGFTVAGANNYTTPAEAGRLASDPLGTLQPINVLIAGSHPYNPSFDTGGANGRRWGDYSYTSLDPCDDMTIWTIQEYASANNQYGMRVAQLKAPPPAIPAAAGTVFDGQASVNVTITGTSSGGSGFYDTPASLTDTCRTRIQAAVSGGVTVNSVTFTDATHVTLNISTMGTAGGLQNVTITNPDGQSSTGIGILDVVHPTSLALSSSLIPSTFGQLVTFTATVTSTSGTPTGSVTFSDGTSTLGTAALSGGVATFSTTVLAGGPHTISASYAGNTSFGPSSGSLSSTQTVNPASTSILLTSSSNPSLIGFPVTFTATVSSSPGLTPTGAVTITVDGSPNVVALGVGGSATLTTSSLAAGTHTVSASYAGSANFSASGPASLTQTVLLTTFLPVIDQ